MTAAEEIAAVADRPVVFVDNAIWLLCARDETSLSNSELEEVANYSWRSRTRSSVAMEVPSPMFEYHCRACGAQLLVRVPFKGRLVWTISEHDPDFSSNFPEPRGEYGTAKLVCSADPLHDTGFHLVDGSVERNLSSKAWD